MSSVLHAVAVLGGLAAYITLFTGLLILADNATRKEGSE